jgi:hypothetical protein
MTDDAKLPSTRQILESDAAALRKPAAPADTPTAVDDESFRRVMTALRVVLQMGGSPAKGKPRSSSENP